MCFGSSIVAKVLNVTTFTLVGAAKNLIEPSVEQSRKSLSYEGVALDDNKSLSFYGFKSNSDLLMAITPTASEEAELPKIVAKKFHASPSHAATTPLKLEFEQLLNDLVSTDEWKRVASLSIFCRWPNPEIQTQP